MDFSGGTAPPASHLREDDPLRLAGEHIGLHNGLAAAMTGFLESEYAGARVIYMRGDIVEGPVGEKLLAGSVRGLVPRP